MLLFETPHNLENVSAYTNEIIFNTFKKVYHHWMYLTIFINAKKKYKGPLLHMAITHGYLNFATKFIKQANKVDLEIQDQEGATPLHLAIKLGYYSIAELLIKSGANLERTHKNNTPLILAIKNNNIEITKLLIIQGADINAPDPQQNYPLHWAVIINNLDLTKLLLEHKAYINIQCNYSPYYTPLHLAAIKGQDPTVKYLLKNKANPNIQLANNKTPLDMVLYYLINQQEMPQNIFETIITLIDEIDVNLDNYKIIGNTIFYALTKYDLTLILNKNCSNQILEIIIKNTMLNLLFKGIAIPSKLITNQHQNIINRTSATLAEFKQHIKVRFKLSQCLGENLLAPMITTTIFPNHYHGISADLIKQIGKGFLKENHTKFKLFM